MSPPMSNVPACDAVAICVFLSQMRRKGYSCGPWSMVKGSKMLISEFARRAGLTTDTVRFYVRRGLITPERNGKGRNPYQVFTADHVRAAKIIRTAQSLGMSLKEIAAISR